VFWQVWTYMDPQVAISWQINKDTHLLIRRPPEATLTKQTEGVHQVWVLAPIGSTGRNRCFIVPLKLSARVHYYCARIDLDLQTPFSPLA